ncbi:WhiB family transcriptional regulator [Kineococcus sp. SYSU DK003]|uniref:WhiB family transcriptional regulator n=1 Tax=Kineococcus sp. SYSU DK003 TaxID=3383124 RepID=UPI003D7ECD69
MEAASRHRLLQEVNAERAQLKQTRMRGCQSDPELFFAEDPAAQRQAQRICWDCPVRRRCLETILRLEVGATSSNGTYSQGTAGGTTQQARDRLVRQLRRQPHRPRRRRRTQPAARTVTQDGAAAPPSRSAATPDHLQEPTQPTAHT